MDALDGVLDAIEQARVRMSLIEERAGEFRRRRLAGEAYSSIVPTEDRPLIVSLLANAITVLQDGSGRFRREEAQALHQEGVTMEEIALLFGVTRQRISELLRPPRGLHRAGSRGPGDGGHGDGGHGNRGHGNRGPGDGVGSGAGVLSGAGQERQR